MLRKSHRRLGVMAIAVLLALMTATTTSAKPAQPAADPPQLTVLTNAISIFGLTPASLKSANTVGSWYRIYHTLWEKQFPGLQIKEIQTSGDEANITKTLLGVNAGNPPDLMAVHGQLPVLVARHAVENLDKYYAAAGLTPDDFLKPMADAVRFNGHWYGLPGATNPTTGSLLYVPKFVKAAGIDKTPTTWQGLYEASKKVVKFADNGDLERIGYQVDMTNDSVNMYCGKPTTYDAATNSFHPSAACVKANFTYRKKLIDLYGGMKKYTKFISGDPSPWTCSPKAYLPTGKILWAFDAYWSGGQMDTCYDLTWKLGPIPTSDGTLKDWAGLSPAAWFLAIPRGAKHPQLAFDFIKFTIFDHGDRLGPTTNGYVRPGQANAWAQGLVNHTAEVRKAKGYAGNPMAAAMYWVKLGAKLGRVTFPPTPVSAYFAQQMALAWQEVAFGRKTVDAALDNVQKLVDQQMKLQPKTIG